MHLTKSEFQEIIKPVNDSVQSAAAKLNAISRSWGEFPAHERFHVDKDVLRRLERVSRLLEGLADDLFADLSIVVTARLQQNAAGEVDGHPPV